jgi:RNA polymerase sigma-70 factor, ECF subfamily
LLRRIAKGDTQAFDVLWRKLEASLYTVAARILPRGDAAQDALQNAAIKVWTKAHLFRGKSAVFSWMYKIVQNEALMIARRDGIPAELHHWRLGDDEDAAQSANTYVIDSRTPEAAILQRERRDYVRHQIELIRPVWREPLIAVDIIGLKPEEFADLAGLTHPSVKSRLHRSRRALKAAITQDNIFAGVANW